MRYVIVLIFFSVKALAMQDIHAGSCTDYPKDYCYGERLFSCEAKDKSFKATLSLTGHGQEWSEIRYTSKLWITFSDGKKEFHRYDPYWVDWTLYYTPKEIKSLSSTGHWRENQGYVYTTTKHFQDLVKFGYESYFKRDDSRLKYIVTTEGSRFVYYFVDKIGKKNFELNSFTRVGGYKPAARCYQGVRAN